MICPKSWEYFSILLTSIKAKTIFLEFLLPNPNMPNIMKILIIDDEEEQRTLTKLFLSNFCPMVEVVGEANSVQTGITAIKQYSPDLILLDIDLGDGTGFDLLKKIAPITSQLIFITAHNDFAIKAFKYSALDYLLKPLDPEELQVAIQKAMQQYSQDKQKLQLSVLFNHIQNEDSLKKIVLKDSDNIYIVEIANIIRLEADKNYTIFYLSDKQKLVISKTMKEFEHLLEKKGFFRCHQSHLVNLNFLAKIDKRDGGMLIMKDAAMVPLATRRKDELMQLLEKF
jgi:two-component system LytT family response regulator